jgi:prepilin-type N-terminal cleavage/methylation domain-containing protein
LIDRLKNESGYSLVEVMVAIMLLTIAIIPMVSMFDAGLRAAVLGGNYDQARALANEKLEEIRALPYSSPDDSASDTANSVVEIYPPGTRSCIGSVDPNFGCQVQTRYVMLNPGSAAIDPNPNARTMMEATVTVTWSGGRSYTTTGLVSKGT